jgi:lycopene cyclase domain-containing protein
MAIFYCIPYACIFMHLALIELSDKWILKQKIADYISYSLFVLFLLVLVFNTDKMYTLFDMSYALLVLAHVFYWNKEILRKFYLTFLAMLVPFTIVNGVLTGFGIPGEVVWYNNSQNLGIRLSTIPIEDFTYAFSMILSVLYLFEIFKKKKITN